MPELLELRLGGVGQVALAALAVIPFVVLGTAIAARLAWVRARLTPSRRSLCADLGYLLLCPVTEVLSRVLTALAIAACALVVGLHVGPELLQGFGPVIAQPRWLVVAEMLVLGDLFYYWTHRMAHTVPWLWRLHAVHHSTTHMRWTSALRAHPAEAYAHVLHVVPLFLLGFPIEGLAWVVPIATLYALLIHSDVELPLGALRYVLNGPAFHRWHHALDVRDGGTNFAGFFPVYDLIFGTYDLPERRPHALGIDAPDVPQSCLAQLVWPFRHGVAPQRSVVMPGFGARSAGTRGAHNCDDTRRAFLLSRAGNDRRSLRPGPTDSRPGRIAMRSSLTIMLAALLVLGACKKEEPPPATVATEPEPAPPPALEPAPVPEPVVLTTADHVRKSEECWAKFNANDPTFPSCFAANAAIELVDTPTRAEGRDGVLGVIGGYRAAFPDLKGSQQLVLASGNKVVTIDLMTGTNTGPLMGAPATGKKLGILAAHVFDRNDAGEVQRESVFFDEGSFMGQLGMNKGPHRAAIEALSAPTVKAIAGENPQEAARLAMLDKVNELLNAKDAKGLMALTTEGFTMSDQTMPADVVGADANIKGMESWMKAFPDAKFEQKWAFAAGDYVVREVAFTGTNTGKMKEMGIKKPTGKTVSNRGLEITQFEGDKAKLVLFFGNGFEVAVQLGLAERPAAPSGAAPAEGAKPEGAAPAAEGAAKPEEG